MSPRAPSHVDRSEQPIEARVEALERGVDDLRRDVAEIMNGEARRDDRLKVDTQQSISSAATMMAVQRAQLEDLGKKLDELREGSKASAEEREKRKAAETEAARKERVRRRAERITLITAVVAALTTISVEAIKAIGGTASAPATHVEEPGKK